MDWYQWQTIYSLSRKLGGYEGDKAEFIRGNLAVHPDEHFRKRLVAETEWERLGRPYYRLYPGVIDVFLNCRLDIHRSELRPPSDKGKQLPTMAICLPKNNGLVKDDASQELTNILFWFAEDQLWLWWEFSNALTYQSSRIPLHCEEPLEASLDVKTITGLGAEPGWVNTHNSEVLRLVTAVLLLTLDDHDLVRPEVLKKDWEKWIKTHNLKFVERAKRNHRYGFAVGEAMEAAIDEQRKMSPHYRRPHLWLQAYGPSHSLRRLRWRKGSWVKREIIEKRPTGYEGWPEEAASNPLRRSGATERVDSWE